LPVPDKAFTVLGRIASLYGNKKLPGFLRKSLNAKMVAIAEQPLGSFGVHRQSWPWTAGLGQVTIQACAFDVEAVFLSSIISMAVKPCWLPGATFATEPQIDNLPA
jgi:hypothetical protein